MRTEVRWAVTALAVVETALLLWIVLGPAFTIRHVDVVGAHRLTPAQVRTAAGLDDGGSVFTLDAATIARRLGGTAWVREASVEPRLPDRVVIRVDEWQPVAVYKAGPSAPPWYLSDQAVALGQAPAPGSLLDLEWPSGPAPKPGRRVMDAALLTALINIQRALPSLLGQQVQSFSLDACGNLTLSAARGWKAYFGRVLTPEEFGTLRDKLSALKSIAAAVDYNSPDLEYVNVMNPYAPAVKLKSAKPAPSTPPPPGPCA
jgi:cell division protein FtsQ